MFVRRRLALLAVVAGLISTTSCSGADKPKTLPPLTQSPTPSATATDPQTDLAAVEAVVRRYYALTNASTSTSVARELRLLMTKTCPCQRVPESIASAAAKGETYFGVTTITSLVPNADGRDAADVLLNYDSSTSGHRDRNGKVLHSFAALKGVKADFRLVRVGDRWLINLVQIISTGRPA